jgi:hypothetical protein
MIGVDIGFFLALCQPRDVLHQRTERKASWNPP